MRVTHILSEVDHIMSKKFMFTTRANTGHAVLRSTPEPPKMSRRNGPTDGRTDGRTDRPSYRGALLHLKISHDLLSGALTSMQKQ